MFLLFSFLCAALFINPAMLCAADSSQEKNRTLKINADTMISQKETNSVEFSGNVVATDIDSVIHADSIKVFLYTEDEKKKIGKENRQNIKQITASGNVKYISGNRKAFSDKAVYTADDQVLVLTGDSPKIITGESFVTGKKITIFKQNSKIIVESGKSKRVEALFNSSDSLNRQN